MQAHKTPTLGTSDSYDCTWELWWEQNISIIHINRLTYQKEYNTNSYIGKDNAHPDFIGQRVQKGEDSWFGFLWLFDHDGDSQRHEGFGEINHFLTNKSDRQGSNCYICFLMKTQRERERVWQCGLFIGLSRLLDRGERHIQETFLKSGVTPIPLSRRWSWSSSTDNWQTGESHL